MNQAKVGGRTVVSSRFSEAALSNDEVRNKVSTCCRWLSHILNGVASPSGDS